MGLLVLTPVTAQADALHDKLNQYQAKYNNLNQQLNVQKQQTETAAQKAQDLQNSIDGLNEDIQKYQADIAQQQSALKSLEEQRAMLKDQQEKDMAELAGFVRASYENNVSNYWAVLLNSKSWSELFDGIYELRYIASYYNDLQRKISDNEQTLAQQQTLVKQKTAELQTSLQKQLETQQQFFQQVNDQKSLVNQLSQQQHATQKNLESTKHDIAYVQEMIRQAQLVEELSRTKRINPGTGGISGPVTISATAKAVVNYALSFQGVPYVWGGNGPSGWDCSGFVKYVYNHFGVTLYRTSEMQFNEGAPVAISDLRPGDLVFFAQC
ncbi:MAG: NlpC/P60 family protein, partial [Firmicutes bacterium]|nr:NlpC/P60 family protein [Bacillota bacterium]